MLTEREAEPDLESGNTEIPVTQTSSTGHDVSLSV